LDLNQRDAFDKMQLVKKVEKNGNNTH